VDFRGVVIGEVKSIGVEFDRAEREFRMPVLVQVYPDRLRRRAGESGVESRATQQERLRFLTEKGLRAQLRSGNLLTGQVYVALDFFPKAPPAKIDLSKNPIELPTVANSLDEIQSQVQEIATKLNKVPYEQIAGDLRTTLATLNKTLTATEQTVTRINSDVTPELAAAMKDVRKTVNSAERTLADDSPLQQDMRQTLQELTRAAGSVRVLTDYLERHPESLLRGKPDDKKSRRTTTSHLWRRQRWPCLQQAARASPTTTTRWRAWLPPPRQRLRRSAAPRRCTSSSHPWPCPSASRGRRW
jgi:paraquat-inducible protein B